MTLFDKKAFERQHILVTGATGGIGAAVANMLSSHGADVTVTGRDEEKLSKLKQQAHYHGDPARIHAVTANLTEERDRHLLIQSAEDAFGPITGLVNSAGTAKGDVVEELKEEDMHDTMEINYTSLVLLTQLVYKQMKEKGKGSIVNISSLSGLRGTYGNAAYSASKFAVIGFTQSFALEAIEHGIRVNAVCPGFVDTEMARGILQKKADRRGISYEEQRKEAEEGLPSGRMTTPEETAEAILFLLSDAASNIVGESMKISGGSVMR
ncbi:SDR family NAD(P)-dependent oxidoreductase [Alkalicoccus chagannorensis]|uniref:SDR family NAD(P)-dependent oxidoreductase n=1 Tax=Alkalicoccus chagannorensis TaxID=427072 RepID=UPI00041A43FC|nr:SDR family oxidoreductase [Alkalicoccus chagannorensis]